MTDLFLSVVDPFEQPLKDSNFIVFKNRRAAVPTSEGPVYFTKCKRYAQAHRAFVVSELMNIADFLCLCMFSPTGRITGAQRALFLSHDNQKAALRRASNLALFDTPYGKVYLCVDADIYVPEVQRHARLAGCEILVSSQWIEKEDYSEHRLFTGCWGAAQTNNVLAVSATNHAGAVCAPYLTTVDNSGYLVSPTDSVFTTFNVSRLGDTQSGYHSQAFNLDLIRAHRELLGGDLP